MVEKFTRFSSGIIGNHISPNIGTIVRQPDGTLDIDLSSGSVFYYQADSTDNYTINFLNGPDSNHFQHIELNLMGKDSITDPYNWAEGCGFKNTDGIIGSGIDNKITRNGKHAYYVRSQFSSLANGYRHYLLHSKLEEKFRINTATSSETVKLFSSPSGYTTYVANDEGTHLIIGSGTNVKHYEMSIGWDLSTLSLIAEDSITYAFTDIDSTGTKLILSDYTATKSFVKATLSTPWDFSTISYDSSVYFGSNVFYGSINGKLLKFRTYNGVTDSYGFTEDKYFGIVLDTPYDVTTALTDSNTAFSNTWGHWPYAYDSNGHYFTKAVPGYGKCLSMSKGNRSMFSFPSNIKFTGGRPSAIIPASKYTTYEFMLSGRDSHNYCITDISELQISGTPL
jgi:hypothetical protein